MLDNGADIDSKNNNGETALLILTLTLPIE